MEEEEPWGTWPLVPEQTPHQTAPTLKIKKMLPVLQNTIVMTISKCPMTYFPPHMCNDTALKPYTVLTPRVERRPELLILTTYKISSANIAIGPIGV